MTAPWNPAAEAAGPAPADYGVRLRRRWWVVVLGVLVGLGAAALFTASQPTRYTSSTSVLVQSTGVSAATGTSTTSRSDVNMDTEAALVTSQQVAEAAKGVLRTATPAQDLLTDVTVDVPSNSQVLDIGYTDSTARASQAGAQAFAQAYLSYRAGQAKQDLASSNTALQADLTKAQTDLKAVTDKIAALPANSPDRTYAEAQRTVLSNSISTLSARLSALGATAPTSGTIISAAELPSSPSSPVRALNLAAGLVVGLLLGLALAILADRLDHRLRHPSDVTRRVGLPLLAALGRDDDDAVFDRLRNTLLGAAPTAGSTAGSAGVRPLQVADVGERGAAGRVAQGLARSLARAGGEATLVVATPGSTLAAEPDLAGRDGLSEVLRGAATVPQVRTRVADLPGIWVVPAGRDPQALETLLQGPGLSAALKQVQRSSPGAVVETAGTGASAGAQSVAALAASVVLVAERGGSDDRLVTAAERGAQQMDAHVAGVVLSGRSRRTSRRGAGSTPATPTAVGSESTGGEPADAGRRRSLGSDAVAPGAAATASPPA